MTSNFVSDPASFASDEDWETVTLDAVSGLPSALAIVELLRRIMALEARMGIGHSPATEAVQPEPQPEPAPVQRGPVWGPGFSGRLLRPVQPVPVSERLPEAEDCAPWPGEDADPWCWCGKFVDGGWEWAQFSATVLTGDFMRRGDFTHWLPAHALPLPSGEERPDDNRDPACVQAWPECVPNGYDPRCCRFPKSCSCNLPTPEATP